MELYWPLGISRLVPQDLFGVLSHIINPLLIKLVRSRWLDIGLVLFLRVYGPRLLLSPISSHLDLTLCQLPIYIYIAFLCSQNSFEDLPLKTTFEDLEVL